MAARFKQDYLKKNAYPNIERSRFMPSPDISLSERYESFKNAINYVRAVTKGMRQCDELDRAVEVALVRK